MALWGSALSQLRGLVGDGTGPQVPLPAFNPLRLESNGLIDVSARPAQVGRRDQGDDVPLGPLAVTLSPIQSATGGPISLVTGDLAQLSDFAALVRFGRGGVQHVALVDWPAAGATFAVNCDSLFVSAWVLVPPTGVFTAGFRNNGVAVRMAAHATPIRSGATRSLLPRRTIALPTQLAAAGGTSGETFLPPFARTLQWQWDNVITAGVWNVALLFRQWGATFAQQTVINSPNRSIVDATAAFPIPSRTQTVVVTNNSAVLAVTNGALVYTCDLG